MDTEKVNMLRKREADIVGWEAQKVWHVEQIAEIQIKIKDAQTYIDENTAHNPECTCIKCEDK